MRVRIVGLVALWVCALAGEVHPQVPTPPPQLSGVGAAVISGNVVDGATGNGVSGALVQLFGVLPDRGAPPSARPRQMTDSRGRFIFPQLAPGSYRVLVNAPGYFDGGFGRLPDSDAVGEITLQDRQWFSDAKIELWKPASISGLIRDEKGEALVDVPVRILRGFRVGGLDQWASDAVTRTDDRGAYRFPGLFPGRYVVHVPSVQITLPSGEVALYRWTKVDPLPATRAADGVGTTMGYFAVPPPSSGQMYPASFYPAARSLSAATVVTVEFGSQRGAVDLSLAPVSSVRVSGVVVGPATAIANLPVRLLAIGNELLGIGGETALTKTDARGRFTLAQVPQGDYTLVVGRALNEMQVRLPNGARQPSLVPSAANPFIERMSAAAVGGEPDIFLNAIGMSGDDVTGRATISVGTEAIDGLVVSTISGVTVSGRALFDGADAPAGGHSGGPFGPNIRLDPADGDLTRTSSFSHSASRSTAPTFSIENVMPGRYRLIAGFNRDYRLVGATWNGQDLFAKPLEVTGAGPVTGVIVYLSSKRNSVSGIVRGSDGHKPAAGAVLVFPQDSERWREPGISAALFRNVDVSVSGSFLIEDLIPGDYFIAAVPLKDRRRGIDIELLKLLAPQAIRFRVDEMSALKMDLRIIEALR